MGKRLAINWNTLKERWLSGVGPKRLSQDFGVPVQAIASRIKRCRWTEERSALAKATGSNPPEKVLAEQSIKTRLALANTLTRVSSDSHRPSGKHLLQAKLAKELAQAAVLVFGWQAPSSNTIVNTQVLASVRLDLGASKGIDPLRLTPTLTVGQAPSGAAESSGVKPTGMVSKGHAKSMLMG